MFVARWQIDVQFGRKDEALALMREWDSEIGKKVGFDNVTYLTGSIGALEARVEMSIEVASLAELESAFAKMAEIPAHKEWGRKLQPLVVSGTSRWEIFRVL